MWGGRWDSNPRSSVPQTDALGQLRYTHHIGAPEGTRTPGPLLRRQVLYPAELQAPVCPDRTIFGAGDGNRTHTTSLEGWGSTTELHPQMCCSQRGLSYHTHPPMSSKFLRFLKFLFFYRSCRFLLKYLFLYDIIIRNFAFRSYIPMFCLV